MQATFATGCFWCTEAIFKQLKGVSQVTSGYTGGDVPHPTYQQVCSGSTHHAEAITLEFDPQIIPYSDLLNIFWHLHDPTTLNRQGNDVGTQYRSAIFYHNEDQHQQALTSKQQAQTEFKDPIVTEILPAADFYPAEPYHQDYYNRNSSQPYCQIIISPKLTKLRNKYSTYLTQETP